MSTLNTFAAEAIAAMLRVEEYNDQFRQPNPNGRYPLCKPVLFDAGRCERCGGPTGKHPCPAVPPDQRWGEDYTPLQEVGSAPQAPTPTPSPPPPGGEALPGG